MKLGWIIVSITHLIHACMEEALLGFGKGGWVELSWGWVHFLLRVVRGMSIASLWLMRVADAFVGSWVALKLPRCCFPYGFPLNRFHIINNLWCVQQFGSSIVKSQLLHKERNINVFTLMCDVCSPLLTHVHKDIGWGWLTFYRHRWTVG